ncbi:MAG: hypothetical protein JWP80_3473 [Pseudomonas sp.]|nr:hypothetical protein [Pseudomonas sp.]
MMNKAAATKLRRDSVRPNISETEQSLNSQFHPALKLFMEW